METSILLAKIIGSLIAVIALGMVLNAGTYKKILKDLSGGVLTSGNPFGLYMAGLFAFVTGALIIANHNIWGWNAFVIITIVGYAGVVKGTLLILFPKFSMKLGNSIAVSEKFLKIYGCVLFLVGAYLAYLGFMA